MIIEEIRDALFQFKDDKYKAFQSGLIPGVDPDCFIGVRTPVLRKYARDLSGKPEIGDFLNDLPHRYFDENQLHAFIVSEIRDYEKCMEAVNRFLPYVDNWATCDQMSPKVFKKYRQDLLEYIKIWICSDETYTIRFGIGMLMQHFLNEDFDPEYPKMVAGIRSEAYYVNMMIAWYFATALAKKYEMILPFIESRQLERWTHNKAIQKALESNRISPGQKEFLRSLKRR